MKDSVTRDWYCNGFLLGAGLLCLWFSPATGGSSGASSVSTISIACIPETPAEGQNVTLSVEGVNGTIREINWFRGSTTEGSTRIFSYFPENSRPQRNGIQNTQREFGFPNGSLLITGVRPSDAKPYTVLILLRPKGQLKQTTELHLAGPATNLPETKPSKQTPSVNEQPRSPLTLGWIVAGVVVGILLTGALGAIMVYRFVLYKADPSAGVAGNLDPKGKKPAALKHEDKEPIYVVMDSPVELPQTPGGKGPPTTSGPLPPLPGGCLRPDSNYMELLGRKGSIYSEITR